MGTPPVAGSNIDAARSTLTESEFIAEAQTYLADLADVPASDLSPDADLVAEELIDSLTLVEFFAFIEEKRGEPIDPERVSLDSLSTIRKAYQLVAT